MSSSDSSRSQKMSRERLVAREKLVVREGPEALRSDPLRRDRHTAIGRMLYTIRRNRPRAAATAEATAKEGYLRCRS